jgi:hypothetical protein
MYQFWDASNKENRGCLSHTPVEWRLPKWTPDGIRRKYLLRRGLPRRDALLKHISQTRKNFSQMFLMAVEVVIMNNVITI